MVRVSSGQNGSTDQITDKMLYSVLKKKKLISRGRIRGSRSYLMTLFFRCTAAPMGQA